MVDRKRSPLVPDDDDDRPPWDDPPPKTDTRPPSSDQDQTRPEPEPTDELPLIRRFPSNGRRKRRSAQALDPFDLVSFNANLPLVLRRMARMLAARQERDVQDVVAEGLLRVFEAEGLEIPTTRAEYDRMVREGRL